MHLWSSILWVCNFIFSFLLRCLCLVLVSGLWWPHRMSLEAFLALQFFWTSLRRISDKFIKYFVVFTCEVIWSWTLFVGSFLIIDSISLPVIGLSLFSLPEQVGHYTYIEIYLFLVGCPFCWHTCMSVVSAVTSLLSFLISCLRHWITVGQTTVWPEA